jgi:hypothetical protein
MRRYGLAVLAASLLSITLVTGPSAGGATVKVAPHTTPSYVYGMSTYVAYNCQDPTTWSTDATNLATSFASIGVKSVGLAFPYYTDDISSNSTYFQSTCGTNYQSPSPDQLAVIVAAAHAAGLSVFLRPTMDQKALQAENPLYWHGAITPSNVSLWFANYLTALTPYLEMAQSDHVESFAIASELSSMNKYSNWNSFITAVKKIYTGNVVITDSWSSNGNIIPYAGASLGIDTYRPVSAALGSWSPAQLLAGWDTLLKTTVPVPKNTAITMDEVGIVAQSGAYQGPNGADYPLAGHPFSQLVQVNWFTMACAFMKEHAFKGIYFWGPSFSNNAGGLPTAPDMGSLTDIQPQAQVAIKNCFGVGSKPTIAKISPTAATVKGGTSVTLTGANYIGTFDVTVGGVQAAFTMSSPTTLVVTMPKHAKGLVPIIVTTEAGTASYKITYH